MATKGLCEFRKGKIEEGRYYYKNAISLAKDFNDNNLLNKAILNYIREELLATKRCENDLIEMIDILHTGSDRETSVMRQDIKDILNRYNIRD